MTEVIAQLTAKAECCCTPGCGAARAMNETNDKHKPLYLEDLHVGQRFTSGSYYMDLDQMKAFAAEFDPQPFHLDEAAAKRSIFRGLAASGWHTAAATMRLLVTGGLQLTGSSASAVSLHGPSRRVPAIRCALKARSSK